MEQSGKTISYPIQFQGLKAVYEDGINVGKIFSLLHINNALKWTEVSISEIWEHRQEERSTFCTIWKKLKSINKGLL